MAHGIVRTDLMTGADVGAFLVSVKFYSGDAVAEIDNGNVVLIGDLLDGEREIRKATVVAANTPLDKVALIASPEVMYEDDKRDLGDFVNPAGVPARGYRLHVGDIFSVTKDALTGVATPAKGNVVELAAGTKLKVAASATSGSTAVGKIFDIETKNGITYYAILVG